MAEKTWRQAKNEQVRNDAWVSWVNTYFKHPEGASPKKSFKETVDAIAFDLVSERGVEGARKALRRRLNI